MSLIRREALIEITRELRVALDEIGARFVAFSENANRRNREGDFGKYPWQRDYGLWPWQRRRK